MQQKAMEVISKAEEYDINQPFSYFFKGMFEYEEGNFVLAI